MGFGKKFALAAGAAVVAFGIAAPAGAVGWGTVTASYKSQARATGYGDFYKGYGCVTDEGYGRHLPCEVSTH